MVKYRTFHNCDPPGILKLWHASNLGPSAAEGFPCDILEVFVFSQPFFDRKGFFVAAQDGRIVGFAHASCACNAAGTALDWTQGIISGLMVHPDFRRKGIGTKLFRRAESYLAERGATSLCAGAGLDRNGFYNGIYGGLQAAGFSRNVAPWHDFLGSLGYALHQTTHVLHRDLTVGRDPVSARIIRHRRRLSLAITDRVSDLPWWWQVRFGQLDALKFVLQEQQDHSQVASGQIIGLDVYVPKWGLRAVGIRDVVVPERERRHGYGLSLVLEICRRLREQSVQLIEAQVDSRNIPAQQLFQNAGFEQVEELIAYRRDV